MEGKVSIDLRKAHRLLHPKLVVLVTSCDENGKTNVMTAAWCMPASLEPPLVAVAIGHGRYTHELIEKSGEFVINIPELNLLKEVHSCGIFSGREIDKLEGFKIITDPSKNLRTKIIRGCVAHLECKLWSSINAGDHTIYLGRILDAYVNPLKVNPNTSMYDLKVTRLIYHLGSNIYTTTKEEVYTV
ncbi:MAG: flavin reductase family protein [Candidatus Asgardarchaeia archaeon]